MEATENRAGATRRINGLRYYMVPGLKSLRKQRGYSQQELAKRAGLSTRTVVWYLENGQRFAQEGSVYKLAEALGVTPMDLVLEPEPETEEGGDESAA